MYINKAIAETNNAGIGLIVAVVVVAIGLVCVILAVSGLWRWACMTRVVVKGKQNVVYTCKQTEMISAVYFVRVKSVF